MINLRRHILGFLPLVAHFLPTSVHGCTSICVGKGATVEGSAFGTHNNDCVQCDPRIAYIEAKDHAAGSQRPIFIWNLNYPRHVDASRSPTYAPVDGQTNTVPIGHIPEVNHTYAYWENSYPLVNEKGLGFGESTCGAKLVSISIADGGEAMMSMGELMRIALERCASARCAIDTMGRLAVEHGFIGEDPGIPGAGESLSVVDPNEAWIFHITGGLHNTSASWVARRVPDNHVAVVANAFIIQGVECADSDNYMCSPNIFSNARELNLCEFETEAEFNFALCYGPDVRKFHYLAGLGPVPYYMTLRMWRIMNLANPSMAVALSDTTADFPFSVPVESKVSRQQVMNWTRDHYENTKYDMRKGILAGPFGNPNRIEGGKGMQQIPGWVARGISIPRTGYGVLVEAKPRGTESIAWLAMDSPASSVFVPFFAAADKHAEPYGKGRYEYFSRDSAYWAFNFVAQWMNINYDHMNTNYVRPTVVREQERVVSHVASLEAANVFEKDWLNKVQVELQGSVIDTFHQLGDTLVASYSDGVYRTPEMTTTFFKQYGYPGWFLQMIGFDDSFYMPQWVKWAPSAPPLLSTSLASIASVTTSNAWTNFIPGALCGIAFAIPLAYWTGKKSRVSF